MSDSLLPMTINIDRKIFGLLFLLCFLFTLVNLLYGVLFPLIVMLLCILMVVVFVTEGYGLLLALGIMFPLTLPVPFVRGIPTHMLVFSLCVVSLFVNEGMGRRKFKLQSVVPVALPILVVYLILRYLWKPALPSYSLGLSMDVSGFRVWAGLFLGLVTAISLPSFLGSKRLVSQCLRGLLLVSLFFTIIFMILMFFPDYRVLKILHSFGLTIGFLQNGWIRFQHLSMYGVVLVTGALLPVAFGVKSMRGRCSLVVLGLLAEMLGAARSGWISLLVVAFAILFLTKRYKAVLSMLAILTLSVLVESFALTAGWIKSDTPGVRVLSFMDEGLRYDTGTDVTVEWRYARWRMAVRDIRGSPFFGKGFGGLSEAMLDYNAYDPRKSFGSNVAVDVASGGTHNGYLSFSRGVGIPACVLLCWVLISCLLKLFLLVQNRGLDSQTREASIFVVAMLGAIMVQMMTAFEVQDPQLWLYFGLGGVLLSIGTSESLGLNQEES